MQKVGMQKVNVQKEWAKHFKTAGPLIRGIAVVIVLVVLAVGADRALKSQDTTAPEQTITASEMVQAVTVGNADTGMSATGVPEGFEEELFSAQGYQEVRRNANGDVVGLVSADAPSDAFDRCCTAMENRGWTSLRSGWNSSGTFSKDQGHYRWASVSCEQVGESTSIVIVLDRAG